MSFNAQTCIFPGGLITANSDTISQNDSTSITLSNSQLGSNYILVNASNIAIDSTVGNGSTISIGTGPLTSTDTFKLKTRPITTGLDFDGINDYISCGNILPSSYTKEAFVYLATTSNQNNIISGSSTDQHAFWAPSQFGDRLSAGHNDVWNLVQDPTPLLMNTWYHVAVSYDNSTGDMKLYKNGLLVSSASGVAPIINGNAVNIAAYLSTNTNVLQGKLDEVLIWNVVRTQPEIMNDMNSCLSGPEQGLVAHYDFEDGTSSTILTDIANGNNGTLVNMDPTTDWVNGISSNCIYCYSDSVIVTVNTNVGVRENSLNTLIVYPNPTTGNITLDLGEIKQDIKVTLINNLGQVIFIKQYVSNNSINLDIDAPLGLYFLKLESNREVFNMKIIKK
jgi:hypothetical protein